MIVGHCAIHLGRWGSTSPPATCRVHVQKIWILRYLNLGQQYVDGYAFFHVHCISFIINSYYTIIKYKIVVKKNRRIQCWNVQYFKTAQLYFKSIIDQFDILAISEHSLFEEQLGILKTATDGTYNYHAVSASDNPRKN